MMRQEIDYQAVFKITPNATALLSTDLVILDVNQEFQEAAGLPAEKLLGRNLFDAFREVSRGPGSDSQPLRTSLATVLESRERDVMNVVRYDLEDPARPGVLEERYWSVINTPICDDVGRVIVIEVAAQEVTPLVRQWEALQAQQG